MEGLLLTLTPAEATTRRYLIYSITHLVFFITLVALGVLVKWRLKIRVDCFTYVIFFFQALNFLTEFISWMVLFATSKKNGNNQ